MKKKRDDLIPFEKSERVIRLERRGKVKKITPIGLFFIIAGIFCIAYCLAICICGFGTWFFLSWGAMGAICILVGAIFAREEQVKKIPRWIRRTVTGAFCLGVLLFCIVEGMIFSGFGATAEPGADYVIILGAQWKETGPSEVLRRRLEKAITYLNDNQETMVIVSGGQGENEPISEAAGMKQYLMSAGIAEERILLEEKSGNTKENLTYSAQLIDIRNSRVVLVTNNFHMFRALKIAEKQGYSYVEGLSASSVAGLLPNNLLREFLSVLKNFAVGNL